MYEAMNALTECLQTLLLPVLRPQWDLVRYSKGLPHDPLEEDGGASSQVFFGCLESPSLSIAAA